MIEVLETDQERTTAGKQKDYVTARWTSRQKGPELGEKPFSKSEERHRSQKPRKEREECQERKRSRLDTDGAKGRLPWI